LYAKSYISLPIDYGKSNLDIYTGLQLIRKEIQPERLGVMLVMANGKT